MGTGSLGLVGKLFLQSSTGLCEYQTVFPGRLHYNEILSEFSFFKLAIAFADQNPPGSGTFDLSVGPF